MDLREKETSRNNPISRYYEYHAKKAIFSYYDKETKEDVFTDTLKIMHLSDRGCITGWQEIKEGMNRRMSSNMRKTKSSDPFKVWCNKKIIFEGPYKENKEKIENLGGSYTNAIFCLVRGEGGVPLFCRLDIKGTSIGAYGEFQDEEGVANIKGKWITLSKGKPKSANGSKWFLPAFTLSESTKKDLEDLYSLYDNVLIPYLGSTTSSTSAEEATESSAPIESKPLEEETSSFPKGDMVDLPF